VEPEPEKEEKDTKEKEPEVSKEVKIFDSPRRASVKNSVLQYLLKKSIQEKLEEKKYLDSLLPQEDKKRTSIKLNASNFNSPNKTNLKTGKQVNTKIKDNPGGNTSAMKGTYKKDQPDLNRTSNEFALNLNFKKDSMTSVNMHMKSNRKDSLMSMINDSMMLQDESTMLRSG